jgi:DNA-binding XRE family transcriptional regulator/quercetin dioxygenase-like cupin family protein
VPVAVLQIGERIRTERARRGMSLRALAREVGLSPSLISQIETGKCQPSVSTLYAITSTLGVSVQDVFGEPGAGADPPGLPGPLTPGRDAAASDGPPHPDRPVCRPPGPARSAGPVACPGQREVLELDSGVTWERLGHAPGSRVDFLLVTYAPGSCSSPPGRLMQHAGTEYGYLIQGELVATLGSRCHRLGPGDAVSFASTTPHSYRNEGAVPAVGVWFVASPDGA